MSCIRACCTHYVRFTLFTVLDVHSPHFSFIFTAISRIKNTGLQMFRKAWRNTRSLELSCWPLLKFVHSRSCLAAVLWPDKFVRHRVYLLNLRRRGCLSDVQMRQPCYTDILSRSFTFRLCETAVSFINGKDLEMENPK